MKHVRADLNARSETGAIWLHTVEAAASVREIGARVGDRVLVDDGEIATYATLAVETGVLVAVPDDSRCFACGRSTRECAGGPSADDVDQIFRWDAGVLDVDGRAGVACWPCFWKTDPDMWISAEMWDALSPVVLSTTLPELVEGVDARWDPASYAMPASGARSRITK